MQAGLKTGMYYLRTRAAADAIKFTVDQQALAKNKAARAAKQLAVATPSALKVGACVSVDGASAIVGAVANPLKRPCVEC